MESGFDALREQIVRRLQQTGEELLGLVEQHQQEAREEALEREAPPEPTDAGLRPLRAAIASLDGADSQAEILARLLEVSSAFASRSALLLSSDAGLKVWSSTGFDESHEGQELGTFDEERWAEACSGRGATLLDSRACAHLAQALEADLPSQGALVPLVLRDEVPALLYADTDNGSAPNLEALQLLTYTAAQCLETLPLRSERPVSTLVALEQQPAEADAAPAQDLTDEESADADDTNRGGAAALGAAAAGTVAVAGALSDDDDDATVNAASEDLETAEEGLDEEVAESEATAEAEEPEPDEVEVEVEVEVEASPVEELAVEGAELEEAAADEAEFEEPETEAVSLEPPSFEAPASDTAEVEAEEEDELAAAEAATEEPDEPEAGDDPLLGAETRQVPTMDLPDLEDEVTGSDDESTPKMGLRDDDPEETPAGPSMFGIAEKAGAAAGAAALAAGSRIWGGSEEEDGAGTETAEADEPEVEEPAIGDPLSTLQTDAPAEPASRSVYDEMGALDAPEPPSVDPVSSLETQVIRTGDLPSEPPEPAAPRVFGPPPPVTPPPAPEPDAEPQPEAPPSNSNEVMPPEDVHEGPGWAFTDSSNDEPAGAPTEGPLHEEARRLARLLVSEIKLYNEEQIEEGRRQGNIYEQLKDDIDRSKRMYEERIDQTVRQSTDYFRDELVRSLADGDAQVLGL
ncbi:MAG: hypothetical protein AAF690_01615 [Acidobacteriota bacterium]